MPRKTLILANPAARSGAARTAANEALRTLERINARRDLAAPTLLLTQAPGEAETLAKALGGEYGTIYVIGGDGTVHEAVNGLMSLPRAERPTVGVIPCGNGDDFGRSLGLSRAPREALKQLETSRTKRIDLGCVNGAWFDQTLSFGLDAAIALQTGELRRTTRQTGTILYLRCGMDQLLHHLDLYHARITLDGGEPFALDAYLLAIQNGPTYGGGFRICPDAALDDGRFDLCWASGPYSKLAAGALFLSAKNGKHVGARGIQFARCSHAIVEFDAPVPCQIDGEALSGLRFEISIERDALEVLVPA